MWKLALALSLLACSPGPTEPETKKVSLNLKETCAVSNYYKAPMPESWESYITFRGIKRKVEVGWDSSGFSLPCGYVVQGDDKAVFTIIYN